MRREKSKRRRGGSASGVVLGTGIAGAMLWGVPALAQGQAHSGKPASPIGSHSLFHSPTAAEVAEEQLRQQAAPVVPPQPFTREFRWYIPESTAPFVRDAMIHMVGRTFFMSRDNFNGTRSRAWAGGGWITYRSGLLADAFGVVASLATSQPLFAPRDEPGTRLLNPDQEALNVLGQAYARVRLFNHEFRGGRQLVDTPLINPQDNRMVPNSYLGATINSVPDKDRNYDYAFGYLWTVKERDSNDFISMSDALAGANIVDRGAPFGMIKYRPFTGLSTVFVNYYIEDLINSAFAQAEYTFQTPKNTPEWMIGANIMDQRSVGADLLLGAPFRTYQASAKVQVAHAGWTTFVAASATGDGSSIFSPFGSKQNYTDMFQASFDSAGEKAIGLSVTYDFAHAFSHVGLAGLTVGAWYSQGWDAFNPATAVGIPDRRELDLWLQYRPAEGPYKGFRARMQYSNVWQSGNARPTQPEWRFLLDYTMLFRN